MLNGNVTKDQSEHATQWVPVSKIQEMLSASDASMAGLWKALGIPSEIVERPSKQSVSELAEYGFTMAGGLNVACEQMCFLVRDYVKANHFLPPSSDIQCQANNGGVECDVDSRPETLTELLQTEMPGHAVEGEMKLPEATALTSEDSSEDESVSKATDASVADESRFDIVDGVAQLFRFYPLREAPFSYPLDTESQGTTGWSTSYEEAIPLSLKAKAWVNLVRRNIGLGVTDGALKEWFGKFDTSTKAQVTQILNYAGSILGNVRFSYPGHSCIEPSVGYVFPRGIKCVGSLIAKQCRVDATGKPVIYLCPPWRAISSSTWMMKQKN